MPPLGFVLTGSKITLSIAGVVGFFGGEEAISAMATVHLYEGRRWLGWFNSPGSYMAAKHFGRMANSRFWNGLFPRSNDSLAVTLGLDGKKGPEYIAALSGTHIPTGHLAYLTTEWSKEVKVVEIEGRVTKPCDITYLAMKHVDYDRPVGRLPLKRALFGFIPITVSVAACVMCALVFDWFCFSAILLGILSSGWTSFVIGKGRLVIKSVNNPAAGSPPGHGILKGEEDVVVIKGAMRDVNSVTKGRLDLQMDSKQDEQERGAMRSHHAIGFGSFLLLFQFLAQLFLILQGSLFGQIMFVASIGVSWGYNSYLSSLEKEKIQANLLFETLGMPEMRRFRAGTRTMMMTFACLLLFHGTPKYLSEEEERRRRARILHLCLPNDSTVWRRWTDKVVDQLLSINHETESFPYLAEDEQDLLLCEDDRKLLGVLLDDVTSAFRCYLRVRETLPTDSSQQSRP